MGSPCIGKEVSCVLVAILFFQQMKSLLIQFSIGGSLFENGTNEVLTLAPQNLFCDSGTFVAMLMDPYGKITKNRIIQTIVNDY